MSVSKVLKGAGKFMKGEFKDMGKVAKETAEARAAKKGPKTTIGPGGILERARGKALENPMGFYQQYMPYHLNTKYTAPLLIGGAGIVGASTALSAHNKGKLSNLSSGEGLSGMTEGGIDGASANVITPGLQAMNDMSSPQARQQSARERDSMQHNSSTVGAEGDIVFALHNMR